MQSKTRVLIVTAFTVMAGSGWWLLGHKRAQADPNGQIQTSTSRQSVELTVYSEDFAMVHEARPEQMAGGTNHLHLRDVSKLLDPQSVLLGWQGANNGMPQLVAQSYDLGVGNGENLLKRYLGRPVEVVRYGNDGHEAERQQGTLMVGGNGETVLQSDNKFYINPGGTIVAPTDADIVTIPQLSVQADSPSAQNATLNVGYLTRGLSWTADYVATIDPKQDKLALECWATVTNRTGTNYPNAKVTLVAGSPNRAVVAAEDRAGESDKLASGSFGGGRMRMEAKAPMRAQLYAPNMTSAQPQSVGDFHAYSISKPTTVVQEQMNRLLMLDGKDVPVIKDYSAAMPPISGWDYNEWSRGAGPKQRSEVAVAMKFTNTEKDGLGAPLPAGAVRLYEPDAAGMMRYIGAAAIIDTPTGERVNLTLARAFDLFTEARTLKSQRIAKHTIRKTVEITLHNEKPADVDIRIVQNFSGGWKMVQEPQKHETLNSELAQWKIHVPASSKPTFTYVVDLKE
jgi:hypothetical protein